MLICWVDTTSDSLTLALEFIPNQDKPQESELIGIHSILLRNKKHSQCFYETLDHFLDSVVSPTQPNAHITLQNIDLFAAMAGPGSYTGVRIGISSFAGFCLALKKPLVLLSNLEVAAYFAAQWMPNAKILSILKANQKEVYHALFEKTTSTQPGEFFTLKRLTDDGVGPWDEVIKPLTDPNEKVYVTGDEHDFLEPKNRFLALPTIKPFGLGAGCLAVLKYKDQGDIKNLGPLTVNYVKTPEVFKNLQL